MFKSYTFDSQVQGKHLLILGAVHGNETAGVFAQQEIMQEIKSNKIKLKSGKITFIPIVNEKANTLDTRFVDENLNRVIKFHQNPSKHEEFIANQLIKKIDEADILLDLHSTHCPSDKPFAFIDYPSEENLDFLSIIPVETALAGWPEIYKNNQEIENYCTEEYAHQHQKPALTVECGYHKDEKSIQIAKNSILNALHHFDIIEGMKPTKFDKKIIQLKEFIIKEKDGCLYKHFNHLDKIKKDEIIATYETGEVLKAKFDCFIIMPNKGATIGSEWFYIGKETL